MKRALLLGVISMAAGGTASANVYLGLGVGTNGFEDSAHIYQTDGRAMRVFGGYRFPNLQVGAISVEAGIEGTDLFNPHNADSNPTAYEYFAAGKYSFPLGNNFEVFGRLGLQQTSVQTFGGGGYLIGAGAEYRLDLQFVAGSIFVDVTRSAQTLTGTGHDAFDSSVNRWMLGLAVSL